MKSERKSNGRQSNLRNLVISGMFAALIYVFTAYLHIPSGNGYTHAGDGLIYLASCILPMPYALAASAVGGALADGLSGFFQWMPATIIIKAVTSLFFTNKTKNIINIRNVLGIIPSCALCVVGYSLYEGFAFLGNTKAGYIAAFAQTPSYLIQVLASTILFISVGFVFDRIGIKKIIAPNSAQKNKKNSENECT